ncbi:amidohydrolase [Verrucosispora sp. WMMD573]|uniref:amidohydrolase n=1 Tax=Verrucosispora sp. WMMD573 TaxID=3015149 RepID=UPI00248CBA43|nr:amidohydrolase [Verrucosispora sp. WMMD573]WBB56461.1 amidohydrolase [Verrucosispora sp. WMMD573]
MTSALTPCAGGWASASTSLTTAPAPQPLPDGLDGLLARLAPELVTVRRHIHAHPELSGAEFETAALVFRRLTGIGLRPRLLPKRNGVICDIGSGDGPLVAFRADLDALPLVDSKDVDYRSTVPGVCHACGHDAHTTILLGLAELLAHLAERGGLPGRVRLIFQPAEESVPSGAPEVIEAGGLDGVSMIFAVHCAPQFPVGSVGVRTGPLTAASATLEIRASGPGGHTARPHLTTDLVDLLGRLAVDVPAQLSRRMDPRWPVSVVWGAVHAGVAFNAIPSVGYLRGTVRSLHREAWHNAGEMIAKLVPDLVSGTGADVEVEYVLGFPPVVNDKHASDLIRAAAGRALGHENVFEAEVSMGGEDFSFYLERVPGSMIRLGVAPPGTSEQCDTHQPGFDIDERSIEYGVRVLAHTALIALGHPDPGTAAPGGAR